MRSYGSTDFSPAASTRGSEPSTGAHWTPEISIASRLLSASDSRPATSIRPTMRHSSVRPSNGMPRAPDVPVAVGVAAAGVGSPFLRFRKSKGTSVLGRPTAVPDRLDDRGIGQRRRVAERPTVGDVAEQATHDLAGAGLGQIRDDEQVLRPG